MPACGTAEAQSDTLCETQPGCHGLTSRGHFWTFWLPGQVSNLGNYNDLWKNSPSISVGHHSLVLLLAKCGLCREDTLCSSWWLRRSSRKPYGLQNKPSQTDKRKCPTTWLFVMTVIQVTAWAAVFSLAWPLLSLIWSIFSIILGQPMPFIWFITQSIVNADIQWDLPCVSTVLGSLRHNLI